MSTRAVRRADRRKQKQPVPAPKSFPWFTALVVAVGVIVVFVLLKMSGALDSVTTPPSAGENTINPSSIVRVTGDKIAYQGNDHLQPNEKFSGTYNSIPPTSGPHDPNPQPWGVYASTQRDENVVHSLEHGGVLIAYNPDVPASVVQQLQGIRSRWPRDKYGEVKIIIEPYPKLDPGQIAVAAWTYLLKENAASFDEKQVTGFVAAHIDQGPEDAP